MFGISAFSQTAFGALPGVVGNVTVAVTGVSSGYAWGNSTWGVEKVTSFYKPKN